MRLTRRQTNLGIAELLQRKQPTWLKQVLETHGFEVEMTKASGDQGVDLLARKFGISIAIQVKGYSGSVGNAAVQQAYTGMTIYGCTHCAVITNSEFTSSAYEAAEKTDCILISNAEIESFVKGEFGPFYGIHRNTEPLAS